MKVRLLFKKLTSSFFYISSLYVVTELLFKEISHETPGVVHYEVPSPTEVY